MACLCQAAAANSSQQQHSRDQPRTCKAEADDGEYLFSERSLAALFCMEDAQPTGYSGFAAGTSTMELEGTQTPGHDLSQAQHPLVQSEVEEAPGMPEPLDVVTQDTCVDDAEPGSQKALEPEAPGKPDISTQPQVPTKPQVPEKHQVPTKPQVSEKHQVPTKPQVSEKHQVPTKPQVSQKHQEPTKPQVPSKQAQLAAVPAEDSDSDWSDDGHEVVVPPTRSDAAIAARLRRIFRPRADGKYLVSQEFLDQYRDLKGGRQKVLELFEKSGYDSDSCQHTVCLATWVCHNQATLMYPGQLRQEVPLH